MSIILIDLPFHIFQLNCEKFDYSTSSVGLHDQKFKEKTELRTVTQLCQILLKNKESDPTDVRLFVCVSQHCVCGYNQDPKLISSR